MMGLPAGFGYSEERWHLNNSLLCRSTSPISIISVFLAIPSTRPSTPSPGRPNIATTHGIIQSPIPFEQLHSTRTVISHPTRDRKWRSRRHLRRPRTSHLGPRCGQGRRQVRTKCYRTERCSTMRHKWIRSRLLAGCPGTDTQSTRWGKNTSEPRYAGWLG